MTVLVRAMQAADLPAVLEVQARAYPVSLHESAEVLLRKLHLAPDWCWVGCLDGRPVAYLFSHPWAGTLPPAVHAWLTGLPPAADCWFVHDLAVEPAYQGYGLARHLLQQGRARARATGQTRALLVAVGGAAAFWERQGFVPVDGAGQSPSAYGAEACLMSAVLPVPGLV